MIVLIYGGSIVISHGMSIGALVAFMHYLGLLAWPTSDWAGCFRSISAARPR